MILIDTNVLVALVDERDRLHSTAARDLATLRGPMGLMSTVLSEACFLLESSYLRKRLHLLLERLPIVPLELEPPWWSDVFAWLDRYAEHDPDLADAMLIVQGHRTGATIWTYDAEFKTLWRTPKGKPIKLATSTQRSRRR